MTNLPAFHFKKAFLGSFLIAVFVVVLFVLILNRGTLFQTGEAEAAAEDNVKGWAWSDNVGWISMNNASDGSAISYGVNINPDNTISGWAWSDNVGWICFGATCDSQEYGNSPEGKPAIAQVDPANGEISGWAKIIAYNDDSGWMALRANSADQNAITYGVKICLQDSCDYDSPDKKSTLIALKGEWYYWAWSDAIGWIDFGPQVNGNHVGVKTDWRPENPFASADLSKLQPQGIFEPLCCVDDTPDNDCELCLAGVGPCDLASIKDFDAYCDGPNQGQPLPGVHLHALNMAIENLNLSQGTEISCKVKSPGLCENAPIVEPLQNPKPKNPCFTDDQCGFYCVGGEKNSQSCQTDADCLDKNGVQGTCSYWEGPCKLDASDDPSTLDPISFTATVDAQGSAMMSYVLRGDEDYNQPLENICIGGSRAGNDCGSDTDCPDGVCKNAILDIRMPWVIESCSVAGGDPVELCYNWKGSDVDCLNNCANPDCANYTIFVHTNTWSDRDSPYADVYRAVKCRAQDYDYYFGNKVKCTTEGDVVFSTNQFLADEPEILCNDGIDNDNNGQTDCGDRNCKSIAYNCIEHKRLCLSDDDCPIGTACNDLNGLCE